MSDLHTGTNVPSTMGPDTRGPCGVILKLIMSKSQRSQGTQSLRVTKDVTLVLK